MTDDMNKVEQSQQTQPQDGMDIVTPEAPSEDPQTAQERAAFNRYVQEQGQVIPSNFKSAEEWFNSLKEAQSQYTKSRQEIAELKKNYSETGVQNPAYDPQAEGQPQQSAPQEEAKPDISDMPDELTISKPEKPPTPEGVSQEDWAKWGQEIDQHGTITDATRQEIATRLKADPVIVDQLVRGRLAMKEQSFNQSAQVVGGADNLKHILKWAGENLPQGEIDAMNRAMQTDAYQSVLLGLQARYQQSVPQQATSPEPNVSTQDAVPYGQTRNPAANQVQAFASEAEMKAAISDPRYRTDNAFRQAVEQRMIVSHQHGYRNR